MLHAVFFFSQTLQFGTRVRSMSSCRPVIGCFFFSLLFFARYVLGVFFFGIIWVFQDIQNFLRKEKKSTIHLKDWQGLIEHVLPNFGVYITPSNGVKI